MFTTPKVVYCTTCKGRTHHLMQTLPRNLEDNPTAKFVVLNYNSTDGLIEYINENHQQALESGQLAFYNNYEPDRFRMAHAKNQAHRLGIIEGGDVLVNLDADNYTGPGFTEYLQDQFLFRNGLECFGWSQMVKGELDRGINGRIAVTRNAFLMSGGYDEKYHEWGPDDEDFKIRLRMLGFVSFEIEPRFLLAVKHSDRARFREYPHVARTAYDRARCEPASPIANAGAVGLGDVWKFHAGHLLLKPIATRIFGIGLHKTGTSSLDLAFRLMGFNSFHWGTALQAREIWRGVTAGGQCGPVNGHYAFSDLPFPLLYEDLYRAYPGSRFILTLRNTSDWLRSVRNHFDPAVNPFCKDWDIAPFTHKLHHMLYGRKTFEPNVMTSAFVRHTLKVLAYFGDKPGALLVHSYAHGWPSLCDFLGVPVPEVPYPHQLATANYPLNYQI